MAWSGQAIEEAAKAIDPAAFNTNRWAGNKPVAHLVENWKRTARERVMAALDAAAAVDGDAEWNAACEAIAQAHEARAAAVYDHAKGPYLECASEARSLKRLK